MHIRHRRIQRYLRKSLRVSISFSLILFGLFAPLNGIKVDSQIQQTTFDIKINDAFSTADKLIETPRCRYFIEGLLKKTVPLVFPPPSNHVEEEFLNSIQTASAVRNAYHGATRIMRFDVVSPGRHRATSIAGYPGEITYWKDFFYQAVRETFLIDERSRMDYVERSQTEMAQTSIHEGIHIILGGGTDVLLGEILSGKSINGKDENEKIRKGSEIIKNKIAANCK